MFYLKNSGIHYYKINWLKEILTDYFESTKIPNKWHFVPLAKKGQLS